MLQAKKSLGQHFLKDENIAGKIVQCFLEKNPAATVLEIGPGPGVLTRYLINEKHIDFYAVEVDARMVHLLLERFPLLQHKIFSEDILAFDFKKIESESISIIGNFPYNISSQILFKILENKNLVPYVTGMFQKEVAKRITSASGNKEYGILSVLVQAFYHAEYLFDVEGKSFSPAPKVESGVIRLIRKEQPPSLKNEVQFFRLIKSGFGKRRKMLRNSLNEWIGHSDLRSEAVFDNRAEQLSVEEWIELSNRISGSL